MPPRIYLDNAATSWPKPEPVYQAVERAMRELGAPAGRSVYREATEVQSAVAQVRRQLADLVGLDQPSHIVFTANGTDALNLALHGLLRRGDQVITTTAEHNSVLRPLRHLQQSRGVEVTYVPCDARGVVAAESVVAALRPETRLVAMIHASNVTGALQPVAQVGRQLREHPALLLVDAAQSLGHVEVTFDELGCDLIAAPGHKGLLGPLGTGLLALRPGVEKQLESTRQGGTGTRSEDDRQPSTLPDKYEAGNLNVPGILGLGAGVAFLQQRGLAAIRQHELRLLEVMHQMLGAVPGVRVFGPPTAAAVGVVSLQIEGFDPQEVAAVLDAAHGIQLRAGLHCAPGTHQALGTASSGGTVRLSLSPFTTAAEVETACAAIRELALSVEAR